MGTPGFTTAAQSAVSATEGEAANNHFLHYYGVKDPVIHIFVYLQVLDFVTTLLGLKLGANEASPFVAVLMHAGALPGVLMSKVLALGLGAICLWLGKSRLLRRANYWYAAVVFWNLVVTLAAAGRPPG
jgi:hypothetical protein